MTAARFLRFWERSFSHQGFAQKNVVGVIDCEKLDRGSTDRRATRKLCTLPLEVLALVIPPRMEQSNQLIGVGVDARDVRPLVSIATVAAQA